MYLLEFVGITVGTWKAKSIAKQDRHCSWEC